MNDDFLHRLRETPPPDFAARLKARLDEMPIEGAPVRRSITLRALLLGFMIGGAAFAVTAISIRGVPHAIERWFAPEPRPPSTTSTSPAPYAPRDLIPGERVVPEESAPHVSTTPEPATRAPISRFDGSRCVRMSPPSTNPALSSGRRWARRCSKRQWVTSRQRRRSTSSGTPRSIAVADPEPEVQAQVGPAGGRAAERRQLQFSTPGGTRIIWIFDDSLRFQEPLP